MNCQNIKPNLLAYLHNEMTDTERASIQMHVQTCPHCQRELALVAGTEQHLSQFLHQQAAQIEPSPQAWPRLQARLASRSEPTSRQSGPWPILSAKLNQIKLVFQGGTIMKKGFAITSVILLLFLSTILFVPQARAVTWGFVNLLLGQGTITQTTIVTIEDGEIVQREVRTVERWQPLSLSEAQTAVDFTIHLPTYLPAGYTEVWVDLTTPLNQVIVSFRTDAGPERQVQSFELYQASGEMGRFLGGEPAQELLINKNKALLTSSEATVYDSTGQPALQVAHILYWQEDGLTFALHSYFLTPDEMVKIAESLMPVEIDE
jgi:hypothetical protein